MHEDSIRIDPDRSNRHQRTSRSDQKYADRSVLNDPEASKTDPNCPSRHQRAPRSDQNCQDQSRNRYEASKTIRTVNALLDLSKTARNLRKCKENPYGNRCKPTQQFRYTRPCRMSRAIMNTVGRIINATKTMLDHALLDFT